MNKLWLLGLLMLMSVSMVSAESWYISQDAPTNFSGVMDQGFRYESRDYSDNYADLTYPGSCGGNENYCWGTGPYISDRTDFAPFDTNGMLWMHPAVGSDAVIRFAPGIAGTYIMDLDVFKYDGDSFSLDVFFWVYINNMSGQQLVNVTIGDGETYSYDDIMFNLSSTDSLVFIVNAGSNGEIIADSTGLDVVISSYVPPCVISNLTDCLEYHFSFNESSVGTTFADSTGAHVMDVRDNYGLSMVPGILGNALNKSNYADFLSISDFTEYDGWTISFWLKPESFEGSYPYILMRPNPAGSWGSYYFMTYPQSGFNYIHSVTEGAYPTGQSLNLGYQANFSEWYFVTQVVDGVTQKLYINGVLVNQGSFTEIFFGGDFKTYIGGTGYQNDVNHANSALFLMDELTLYSAPMNDALVLALYENNGSPYIQNMPVPQQSSSSGSGTRYLVDASGNVVGVMQGQQLVQQQSGSAPQLSIAGEGVGFDIVAWFKDLWVTIQGWFG